MNVGLEFTEPDPLGTPDLVLEAHEVYECPCGGLKVGPASFSHPGFSMQAKCPGCGTLVEHVAHSASTTGGNA